MESANASRGVATGAIQQVDNLAENVRVRLVQRTGLPRVNQSVREVRVGVCPFVGHDVVGADAGACTP